MKTGMREKIKTDKEEAAGGCKLASWWFRPVVSQDTKASTHRHNKKREKRVGKWKRLEKGEKESVANTTEATTSSSSSVVSKRRRCRQPTSPRESGNGRLATSFFSLLRGFRPTGVSSMLPILVIWMMRTMSGSSAAIVCGIIDRIWTFLPSLDNLLEYTRMNHGRLSVDEEAMIGSGKTQADSFPLNPHLIWFCHYRIFSTFPFYFLAFSSFFCGGNSRKLVGVPVSVRLLLFPPVSYCPNERFLFVGDNSVNDHPSLSLERLSSSDHTLFYFFLFMFLLKKENNNNLRKRNSRLYFDTTGFLDLIE